MYKKILKDLKSDLIKNLLLILSIAIGVFAIGTILGGYAVLKREMARNYLGTNPASATLEVEGASLSSKTVQMIRQIPYVKDAERHATISARMKIGNDWRRLLLFVIDDFATKSTNKFSPMRGQAHPDTGSMLVERTSLSVMGIDLGESLLIKTPHGKSFPIQVSGVVHDPSLAPSQQEQSGYGYITLETLHALGETQGLNELRVVFTDTDISLQECTQQAQKLGTLLTQQGYKIHEIQVPPPRRHPHQGQSEAVLNLFVLFTFCILILSSVLVATALSTLMLRQIREIAIMKSIGADSKKIAKMYGFMILLLCAAGMVLAIPLSRLSASGFYTQIASLLNIDIVDPSIPEWVMIVQLVSGVLIPIMAALFPVLQGSRISIRQAMTNYGVRQNGPKPNILERFISKLGLFRGTLTLSLRNMFRKRGRLLMTLMLLSTAGSLFMSALNISQAWDKNLTKIYQYRLYDLEVRLESSLSNRNILNQIHRIPGVKSVEAWDMQTTAYMQDESFKVVHTYPDKGHGSFITLAIPTKTNLLALPFQAGRWFKNDTSREVVLNQMARAMCPNLVIGDKVPLEFNGKVVTWTIVGFVEEVGSPATAFVSQNAFKRISGKPAETFNQIRIAYDKRDPVFSKFTTEKIEALLDKEEIPVIQTLPVAVLHNAMAEHMAVLVQSLLALSVLMGFVGTLGLMATMSMNILERTREIGVLRAIGATPGKIFQLVVGEGLFTGMSSLVIGFLIALPISLYIGRLIGSIAFKTPLGLTVSNHGVLAWIVILLIGSTTATLYPAFRATKITPHKALSYE